MILKVEIDHNRIFGLDILRCLAIMLVLIAHGNSILKPIISSTKFMGLCGYWGVELFFVLSGFLIGNILIKLHQQGLDSKSLYNFWRRRWFRTLPNYYLVLAISVVIYSIVDNGFIFSNPNYLAYFVFAQNMVNPHPSFFGEAWSLTVEEWFYLVFPIFVLLSSKLLPNTMSKKYSFLIGLVILLIISLFLRVVFSSIYELTWDSHIRKVVIFRLDSILTGVLFAWVYVFYNRIFGAYRWQMLLLSLVLLIASLLFYYWDVRGSQITGASGFSKTLGFNLTSFAFAFSLPLMNSLKVVNGNNFVTKLITTISIVSYSMYLLHRTLILLVLEYFLAYNNSVFTSLLFFSGYVSLTIWISIIFYNFYERPMMMLRDFNSESTWLKLIKDYATQFFNNLKYSTK